MDQRDNATAEADSGAVDIVPSEPAESELIQRISTDDPDMTP